MGSTTVLQALLDSYPHVRSKDTLVRRSGEEFVVAMPSMQPCGRDGGETQNVH